MSASVQIRSPGQILKASVLYFGIVFSAGFVFGVIRVRWVVPQLGVRNAELLEQPLMLIVVFITAKWIVHRFAARLNGFELLGIGFVALGILLLAEILVTLVARPNQARDPLSSTVYFAMLGLFAVVPWLVSKGKSEQTRRN